MALSEGWVATVKGKDGPVREILNQVEEGWLC
jgi:hypothetical protein